MSCKLNAPKKSKIPPKSTNRVTNVVHKLFTFLVAWVEGK